MFLSEIITQIANISLNDKLRYSLHYPPDATLIMNDDPLQGISITGPLIGNKNWPQFTISHPSDREDYRPPEKVDLARWLTDHNLLADKRQPDLQIAGTTAIHTRHDCSPQSFADDRYFFAKSGQLFMVVIGHAGDKEDWGTYNRFLESIQFKE